MRGEQEENEGYSCILIKISHKVVEREGHAKNGNSRRPDHLTGRSAINMLLDHLEEYPAQVCRRALQGGSGSIEAGWK